MSELMYIVLDGYMLLERGKSKILFYYMCRPIFTSYNITCSRKTFSALFIEMYHVSCILCSVFYILFCILCPVFCVLYFILCSVFCVLYFAFCILYCVLYSVSCILCSIFYVVFCILCSVFVVLYFILCSVFCVLHFVFCTLNSVFWINAPHWCSWEKRVIGKKKGRLSVRRKEQEVCGVGEVGGGVILFSSWILTPRHPHRATHNYKMEKMFQRERKR